MLEAIILPAVVFLGAIPLIIFVHKIVNEEKSKPWREAADTLGLRFEPGTLSNWPKISGFLSGFQVEAGNRNRGKSGTLSYVRLRGTNLSIRFRAEGLDTRLEKAVSSEDVICGDREFDDKVFIRGDREDRVLAALDEETRRLLKEMAAEENMRLDSGDGFLWESLEPVTNPSDIVFQINRMTDMVRRLTVRRDDIPARLAQNVRGDGLPGVRVRSLAALQRDHASSPETQKVAREVLGESDPELRLMAASCLGEEGAATILEIFNAATGALWAKAVEALGRIRHRPALDTLLVRAASADAASLPVLILAVARIGGETSLPWLMDWLNRSEDAVQIAAARALGETGTVKAVEPLLKCAESSNLLEGAVKRECRAAVTKIQARLEGADGGRLSLAEAAGTDGALSLGGEGGELSIPKTEGEGPA